MQTLQALVADSARGSVEIELVATVTITGEDPQRVHAAGAAPNTGCGAVTVHHH
jgi:hypothetical protein